MNAGDYTSLLISPAFAEIDRHFARLVERLAGGAQPEVALAAALVSRGCGQGHSCLNLQDHATIEQLLDGDAGRVAQFPSCKSWLEKLRASPVVGMPGEFKPLVLDAHGRLYLHRYWEYESELATAIRRRAVRMAGGIDETRLADGLRRLFPQMDGNDVDLQKEAALVALRRNLCIISGGPGTGKTRTVALALALLLEQAGATPMRIALAAPTGKAAARLQESVRHWRGKLDCAEQVRERFPAEASTVHRLLGGAPGTTAVRFDAEHPLPVDVLVLDEASMVDVAMMAKVFAALPEQARIILIGDRDQLASVEAGAVLGDICGGSASGSLAQSASATVRSHAELSGGNEHDAAAQPSACPSCDLTVAATPKMNGGLANCIVQLEKNYRFAPGNGILELSRAVNRGDAEGAVKLLSGAAGVGTANLPAASGLKASLRTTVTEQFAAAVSAREPGAALAALDRFRILSALRQGPFGAENLNRLVEEILHEAGLISRTSPWYPGRPVLVTENDYSLRLFNGDIGVLLPERTSKQPMAFFGSGEGQPRAVPPARLPRHETVYAMTVHKSQGSEFERVLLVLPDRESPVLTRELVYTGVTRASESVELWMNEPVFRTAVARRVERASGLREALWPQ
jgi:exodeoxyribonuclease V alpha subunit